MMEKYKEEILPANMAFDPIGTEFPDSRIQCLNEAHAAAIIQDDVINELKGIEAEVVNSCIHEFADIIHPSRINDTELAHTLAISEDNRRALTEEVKSSMWQLNSYKETKTKTWNTSSFLFGVSCGMLSLYLVFEVIYG